MKTSEKVLQLLLKKQAFLSGQELADELNVSRTAVWKAIQSLQEEGYQIESKPRIGYRYIEGLKLSEASIRRFLNPELDLILKFMIRLIPRTIAAVKKPWTPRQKLRSLLFPTVKKPAMDVTAALLPHLSAAEST